MEHLLHLGAQQGRHYNTNVLLCDMSLLSMAHLNSLNLSLLKRITELDEKYYPNLTQQIYIINAPAIMSIAWTMISSVLPLVIKNKVQFIKSASELHLILGNKNLPPCVTNMSP